MKAIRKLSCFVSGTAVALALSATAQAGVTPLLGNSPYDREVEAAATVLNNVVKPSYFPNADFGTVEVPSGYEATVSKTAQFNHGGGTATATASSSGSIVGAGTNNLSFTQSTSLSGSAKQTPGYNYSPFGVVYSRSETAANSNYRFRVSYDAIYTYSATLNVNWSGPTQDYFSDLSVAQNGGSASFGLRSSSSLPNSSNSGTISTLSNSPFTLSQSGSVGPGGIVFVQTDYSADIRSNLSNGTTTNYNANADLSVSISSSSAIGTAVATGTSVYAVSNQGSANSVGGATVQFGSVTTGGSVDVTYKSTAAIKDLPAALPDGFALTSNTGTSLWDVNFDGSFTNGATLFLKVDPASLTAGTNYTVFHYLDGAWVAQGTQLDYASGVLKVTVTGDHFSPFALFEASDATPEPAMLALLAFAPAMLGRRRQ